MAMLTGLLETPYFTPGVCIALLVILISSVWDDLSTEVPHRGVPLVGKNWWNLSNKKARAQWSQSARTLITEGFAKGQSVFQVMTPSHPTIILHPKYIDEVKAHPDLHFLEAIRKNFFANRVPGFEGFHAGGGSEKGDRILVDAVRVNLTQALGSLTTPLMKETALTLDEHFPPTKEWTPYIFARELPYAVGRISTLIFLGERAARNKEWVNVAVNYTIDAFDAARALRMWPAIMRPLVHHFLPYMNKVRAHLKVGRAIVQEEIERRAAIREGRLPAEETPHTHSDSLDWFTNLATRYGEPYDLMTGQMGLSLAAIHTTSNLLTNVVYDLAAHPEYFQPLREEIKAVLEEGRGAEEDESVEAEVAGYECANPPPSLIRIASKKITLSDGNIIPKGAITAISAHVVNEDESIYPNAATYDGYRFLKKRQQPGHEHRHQLVTTTAESFGFGHGVHACPGRFFASNESKIVLLQLLLKYDWKFQDGVTRPKNLEFATESVPDPTLAVLFRAREPEVDLGRFYDLGV
ncbi:Cytochrome P450 [Penicillium chermesinum]|nr:Cytochrome P450 [Penicillium chermesinum]